MFKQQMVASLLTLSGLSLSNFNYHAEQCGKAVYKVTFSLPDRYQASVQEKQEIVSLKQIDHWHNFKKTLEFYYHLI